MTLLWFTVGFVLAALLGVYTAIGLWCVPAAILALALSFFLRRFSAPRPPAWLLLGAGLSFLWLAVYTGVFLTPARDLEYRTVRLEAIVTDWPEETRFGVRIPVKAGEEEGRKVRALFYGDSALADLRPGDRLNSIAYCTPADRGRGEDGLYYTSRGILLRAKSYGEVSLTRPDHPPRRYAMVYLAKRIRNEIDRLYPEKQAGFLHALLTGDRSGLDDQDRHNFNRVGLAHVVVISGLHVSVLMGLLSQVFPPQRRFSLPVLLSVLLLFCLMTGSAPGTVRASILCAMALIAPRLDREYHPLTGLAAALLALLTANPYAIANAGLQFSFLSTLGIFRFGQPWSGAWSGALPRRGQRLTRPLAAVAAISLGSMLFTIPLSAFYFGQFSLIAPLSNLLTAWAVSAAFLGGMLSVAVGAVLFPLGRILAAVVGLPIRFFFWFSAQASRFPMAALSLESGYYLLWTIFTYGILFLYLFAPTKEKRPILPICCCVMTLCLSTLLTAGTARREDLRLTVLDVGQGQSVVVLSGGDAVLIDCGGTKSPGDTAATYLQSLGRSSLDLLILTHFHEDHAGGVPELLDRVQVGALVLPDIDPDDLLRLALEEKAAAEEIPVFYISEESQVALDGAELTILPPVTAGGDSNEQCLSVLCSSGQWDALLTGDMPEEEEEALLSLWALPDLELFVAGHHGSKYATGEALLRTLTPETVVISVGENSYGHPAPETLERLAQANAQVYRTDQSGTITVYANGKEAD